MWHCTSLKVTAAIILKPNLSTEHHFHLFHTCRCLVSRISEVVRQWTVHSMLNRTAILNSLGCVFRYWKTLISRNSRGTEKSIDISECIHAVYALIVTLWFLQPFKVRLRGKVSPNGVLVDRRTAIDPSLALLSSLNPSTSRVLVNDCRYRRDEGWPNSSTAATPVLAATLVVSAPITRRLHAIYSFHEGCHSIPRQRLDESGAALWADPV